MTLKSNAQVQFLVEPMTPASQLPVDDQSVLEVVSPMEMMHDSPAELEVGEPVDIEIVVEELPGAPQGTKDPEPVIEVADEGIHSEEKPADDANQAKSKKDAKWDWESHGSHGFVNWIKARLDDVPKHSGYDSAGLERAVAYLEKLDSEISKAMRLDLDSELDANKVEEVRVKIDDGISRLHARLDKVKKVKKTSRRSKKSEEELDGLVKTGQKILGVSGVYIMTPLLISGLARICVNGCVSAGHDIEDLYGRQVDRWKLSEREQFELRQLLFDMGFPIRADRGFAPDEDLDVSESDNMDWAANYKG